MLNQPLVSVVLPTYNRMAYLPFAVESVFAQTHENWELIIADDGSDEPAREYLRRLEHLPRVTVMWLAHSGNPGAVRNAALRRASGEYVALLDSDDGWMPRKLATQIASMQAAPERRWSYTEYVAIDGQGDSIDSRRNPNRVLYEGRIVQPLLELRSGIALPTVMATRELLQQAGGFDEEQGLHEDYDLWLRLALISDVQVAREPLGYVRTHNEHFSSGGVRNHQARARVLGKMQTLMAAASEASVLPRVRARNAVGLSMAHAALGERRAALRTLAGSFPYSWRFPAWYAGVIKASARTLAPASLVNVIRRRQGRSVSTPSLNPTASASPRQ